MVREKFGVRLNPEERNQLEHLVRAGKSTARVTTSITTTVGMIG